jgi:hypothetical protein
MAMDFKPPRQPDKGFGTLFNWKILVLVLSALVVGGYFLFSVSQEPSPPAVSVAETPVEGPPATPAAAAPALPEIKRDVRKGAVQPGETITSLFADIFSPQEIYQLVRKCKDTFPLSRIRAGNLYEIHFADGQFDKFVYDIDQRDQLIVSRLENDFAVACEPIPYEVKQEVVRANILTSLFSAVNDVGERPELAISLADIFAWDIDFIRDIREGDSFKVLVEKRFRVTALFWPLNSITMMKSTRPIVLRRRTAAPITMTKKAKVSARPS